MTVVIHDVVLFFPDSYDLYKDKKSPNTKNVFNKNIINTTETMNVIENLNKQMASGKITEKKKLFNFLITSRISYRQAYEVLIIYYYD